MVCMWDLHRWQLRGGVFREKHPPLSKHIRLFRRFVSKRQAEGCLRKTAEMLSKKIAVFVFEKILFICGAELHFRRLNSILCTKALVGGDPAILQRKWEILATAVGDSEI